VCVCVCVRGNGCRGDERSGVGGENGVSHGGRCRETANEEPAKTQSQERGSEGHRARVSGSKAESARECVHFRMRAYVCARELVCA